jgi:hydroxymethylpyrimidine pyrophosphatase-like HAD family hydrolase
MVQAGVGHDTIEQQYLVGFQRALTWHDLANESLTLIKAQHILGLNLADRSNVAKVGGLMKSKGDPIRLIAIDLDGTLLTSEGILAPMGSQLLKQAAQKGVHVIPATSRVLASVRPFCQQLGINGPAICTNGAQIYGSTDGQIWSSLTFPKEIGLEIASLADANGWEISATIDSVTYHRQRPGQALGPLSEGRVVVVSSTDSITTDIVQIHTRDPEAIKTIQALIGSKYSNSCCIDVYYSGDGTIS